MEFRLRPLGFMELFWKKLEETQWSQSKFHGIKYIYLICIYLILLLYNSSILDIEHPPYYIELGLPQTNKVIYCQPTLL